MVKNGDNNTRFFHIVANGRKAGYLISSLNIDGRSIVDKAQIEKVLITNFQSLYEKQSKRLAWFKKWEGKTLTAQKSEFLEKEFTSKEIKSAVFALPSEKAPGLNDFPMLFY